MKRFTTMLVLAAAMFSFAACNNSSATKPETTTSTQDTASEADQKQADATNQEPTGDEIVIGMIGPLTGDNSIYGQPSLNGAEMFFKQNPEVLGKKIKIIKLDDLGKEVDAANNYIKLVEKEKAVAIIGPITSTPSIAVAGKAQDLGVPMITPSGTSKDITEVGPNVFRACFIDPYQGETMAAYAISKGYKNVAILFNQSDDYSIGVAEAFKEVFEKEGGTIVANEAFNKGDTDFKAQLSKIKEVSPEVLFLPTYYQEVNLIANQLKDIDFKVQLMGVDGWDGVLNVVNDPSIVEGALFCNHFTLLDEAEKVKKFVSDYETEYKTTPNAFSALGYDSAAIVYNAIEKAGSTDKDAITEAIKNTDLSIVTSGNNLKYDENRNPIKDIMILQITNGEAKLVEKFSAK